MQICSKNDIICIIYSIKRRRIVLVASVFVLLPVFPIFRQLPFKNGNAAFQMRHPTGNMTQLPHFVDQKPTA